MQKAVNRDCKPRKAKKLVTDGNSETSIKDDSDDPDYDAVEEGHEDDPKKNDQIVEEVQKRKKGTFRIIWIFMRLIRINYLDGSRLLNVSYIAPAAIAPECKISQTNRWERMKEAFQMEDDDTTWIPDDQDIIDEQQILLANVMKTSDKYAEGKTEMSVESRKRMMAGLTPIALDDKRWVTSTVE